MIDYLALAMEQDREDPEENGEDRELLFDAVRPSAGAFPLRRSTEDGKAETDTALRAEEGREEENEQEDREKEPEEETKAGESGVPLSPALNEPVPVPTSRQERAALPAEADLPAGAGEGDPSAALSAETAEELRPLAQVLAGEMTLPRWSRRLLTERIPAEERDGPEAASAETLRSLAAQGASAETLPLLDRLRAAQRGEGFVRSQRRAFTVTLPDALAAAPPAWSVADLDRAVERDARRYGGEFRLY